MMLFNSIEWSYHVGQEEKPEYYKAWIVSQVLWVECLSYLFIFAILIRTIKKSHSNRTDWKPLYLLVTSSASTSKKQGEEEWRLRDCGTECIAMI